MLVLPGKLFCSWISVGTFIRCAAASNGPLAYPPTPTATWGLKVRTRFRAFIMLRNKRQGSPRFFTMLPRWKPRMGRASIR
jgi:hypothetical protein